LGEQLAKIDVALLVDLPREIAVQRIVGRSQQEGRADDSEAVAEKRYEVYMAETAPLIPYYDKAGLLNTVDGNRTMDAVTDDLLSVIKGE
jgi:adenylate kinase